MDPTKIVSDPQHCCRELIGIGRPDVVSLNFASLEKMGWYVPGMMHP
jgi:hypothetical protein